MSNHLQKTVHFYGDDLLAIRDDDSGAIYLPVTRVCANLGITAQRQAQRLREHPVLSTGLQTLSVEASGIQEMLCIRLDLVPLWLAGVNANRVAVAVRDKLIRYQTEAASVLWAAFRADVLPTTEFELSPGETSGAMLAYEIGTAIQHLARQQMEMEQRIGTQIATTHQVLNTRIDQMARWANDFRQLVQGELDGLDARVAQVESHLLVDDVVTEAQATEIALAVKQVGQTLAENGARSGYAQVYSEMYRRYGISSYKNLPQRQLSAVLTWLSDWYEELRQKQGI